MGAANCGRRRQTVATVSSQLAAAKSSSSDPGIVVDVPKGQIENCRKRNASENSATALHQNIAHKGKNAYYQAHSRHFEIPSDAKVVSGPGLVTGGAPEKLQGTLETVVKEDDKVVWLKSYSWADAGAKVKVYVPLEGISEEMMLEELVTASFESRGFQLEIAASPKRSLKIDKLRKEINAEESKIRVEQAKNRITVVLAKKQKEEWPELVAPGSHEK
eukprot:TRINITY_DN35687_c0_g1_i1.p1 TRINITY_DN35687_c0_g1~~TRINITY_DN35687_c0_g1_i1.p1  ORF type:complete len:226 (-),score=64.81 TRINITY_DN35687_c0_g1_i1:53-706(-)